MNRKYFNAWTLGCLLLLGNWMLPTDQSYAQEASLQSPTNKHKPQRHLYLLIGQSNMAGRATIGQAETAAIERCQLFNSKNQWEPATNPLNRFSTIRKGLSMQKLNPGYSFATSLLEKRKDITVGLIVNAKGGSKIEEWKKGTRFYQEAVKRTRIAMKSGELKGILWHQGEGNSAKPDGYLDKLAELITNFRTDLGHPELPFVAGQIVGKEKINEQIARLPERVPHTGVASSLGLTAFDRWHFDTKSMKTLGTRYAEQMLKLHQQSQLKQSTPNPVDALSTRRNFEVAGRPAFVMMPTGATPKDRPIPWIWYAPTLGKNLPGGAEKWMFDKFHTAGIAVAGVDVGESYGSPAGRKIYQQLYEHLTKKLGFAKRPVLLARSRGGLMLYSWAAQHPESVGGIVGIYPVCSLTSYPGIKRAAPAFKLTPEELTAQLDELNPINQLESLAKQKVPIFHIHGDRDQVVPLEENSAELRTRYSGFGGPVKVQVIKGQGHNMWNGWFTSEELVKFAIDNATRKPRRTD